MNRLMITLGTIGCCAIGVFVRSFVRRLRVTADYVRVGKGPNFEKNTNIKLRGLKCDVRF